MEEGLNHKDAFATKRELPTLEERRQVAEEFIASLEGKPLKWTICGSTARGDFRPRSDLDILGLYEKDKDIPLKDLTKREDPKNGLVDGTIDFHCFARDWPVFKTQPDFLKEFEKLFD